MIKGLIIGSHSLSHWYSDFNTKLRLNDIDIIGEVGGVVGRIEKHELNDGFKYILEYNKDRMYIDPNFLYTLKISHAEYDIHWNKTIKDIVFLKSKGCHVDYTLLTLLKQHWKIKHRNKKINLNKSKYEFFNNNITRQFDHDHIHELVKVYQKPMHTYLKKDGSEVMFDFNKWQSLSYKDKLITAAEEIWTFSLERYNQHNPSVGFNLAIKQLITSSTTGYFCLFLILNYDILLKYKNNKKYKQLYRRFYDERASNRVNGRVS